MKKLTYAILLAAISLSFLSGCNSGTDDATFLLPKPGEDVDCVGDFCDQPSEDPVDVYAGPTSVTSTDGTYSDKVGVDWALVNDAVTYNVYRSTSPSGPFTSSQLVASVNAEDCVKDTGVVEDPGTVYDGTGETTPVDPTCTNPVMQATYVSDVNLNNEYKKFIPYFPFIVTLRGIYVELAETYKIRIKIGSTFTSEVVFQGSKISFDLDNILDGLGYNFTSQDVLDEFKNAVGNRAICSLVVNGDRHYLRIVSNERIVFESIKEVNFFGIPLVPMPPLEKFLKDDATWDTVITANPVQIGCDDSTPPTVSAVSPQSGVTDVAPTSSVSVAFSEAINPSTLNETSFTISTGGTAVVGTVSNGSTFAPSSPLEPGTTYTATITTAVTDLAGNHLAADYTWSFTTSSSSSAGYFYTDTAVSTGERYYYAVTAVNAEGEVSTLSPADEGYALSTDVPGRVENLAVTSGAYLDRVVLAWQAATDATYYKVYRSDGTATVQIGQNIAGTTMEDTTVDPGIYSYKVVAYNEYGMGGNSDSVAGYRAVTNEEFFTEAYNELESAFNKLGELGTSDKKVYDKDGDGTCVYDVTILSAKAVMTFTNYSDIYLTLDGSQTTHLTDYNNMDGTIVGQLNVTGIYTGYIIFDLVLTGGEVSDGTYTIKQTGGTETTLPGTYVP
ncbi:MAG: Ig-like domain-containing protein [Spirochaetes bacterium]|nr:Ig-like domain-containing protein [Spirochaetota bacterium]